MFGGQNIRNSEDANRFGQAVSFPRPNFEEEEEELSQDDPKTPPRKRKPPSHTTPTKMGGNYEKAAELMFDSSHGTPERKRGGPISDRAFGAGQSGDNIKTAANELVGLKYIDGDNVGMGSHIISRQALRKFSELDFSTNITYNGGQKNSTVAQRVMEIFPTPEETEIMLNQLCQQCGINPNDNRIKTARADFKSAYSDFIQDVYNPDKNTGKKFYKMANMWPFAVKEFIQNVFFGKTQFKKSTSRGESIQSPRGTPDTKLMKEVAQKRYDPPSKKWPSEISNRIKKLYADLMKIRGQVINAKKISKKDVRDSLSIDDDFSGIDDTPQPQHSWGFGSSQWESHTNCPICGKITNNDNFEYYKGTKMCYSCKENREGRIPFNAYFEKK